MKVGTHYAAEEGDVIAYWGRTFAIPPRGQTVRFPIAPPISTILTQPSMTPSYRTITVTHNSNGTVDVYDDCLPLTDNTLPPAPAPKANPPEHGYQDGAIRAWRVWNVMNDSHRGDVLGSIGVSGFWIPGVNVADPYGYSTSRSQPWGRQQHGFWGYYDWDYLLERSDHYSEARVGLRSPGQGYGEWVVGSFLAFGRCWVHEFGIRAQCAIPEYFVVMDPDNLDSEIALLTLAEKYGTKIIGVREAEELKTGAVPWKATPEQAADAVRMKREKGWPL